MKNLSSLVSITEFVAVFVSSNYHVTNIVVDRCGFGMMIDEKRLLLQLYIISVVLCNSIDFDVKF